MMTEVIFLADRAWGEECQRRLQARGFHPTLVMLPPTRAGQERCNVVVPDQEWSRAYDYWLTSQAPEQRDRGPNPCVCGRQDQCTYWDSPCPYKS